MDRRREERGREVFDEVAGLAPDDRPPRLSELCGEDSEVRDWVERLLRFHDSSRMQPAPPSAESATPWVDPLLGASIGGYRVLRLLGAGGMGRVYEAEQSRPLRRVALKVLATGIWSDEARHRFGREAQLLGALHHPGIAAVHETGVEESARGRLPWIAMELIPGTPLNDFVRDHELSMAQRLELLALVCDAVAHAHGHHIVHRDLKPSNILVEEFPDGPRPKVLDFGIAKAVGDNLLVTTLHTETGRIIGTLQYMSPEQALGRVNEVDARSDVYSLGLILYETLSGKQPYELGGSLAEVVRRIVESEPAPLGSHASSLRGDLATIADKAMAKERARRYANAGELADDLRRVLHHAPIAARPPSTWYTCRKFARRHRVLLGSVAAVVIALVVGLVTTLIQKADALDARDEARSQQEEAEFRAYAATIAAADAALRAGDTKEARARLDLAPRRFRHFEWWYLWKLLDGSRATYAASQFVLSAAAASPDGRLLGALRQPADRGLLLWDVDSPSPVAVLAGDHGSCLDWRFSPDGARLVAAYEKGLILLWERGHWDAATVVRAGGREVALVTFLSDGRRVRVVAADGTVQTMTPGAADDQETQVLEHASQQLLAPDGSWILFVNGPKHVLWDVGTRSARWETVGQPEVSRAIASMDGRVIATAGKDRFVVVRSVEDGRTIATCGTASTDSRDISLSPDGNRLAVGCQDNTVRLFDATRSGEASATLIGHRKPVLSVAWSPDGRTVYSTGEDKCLKAWDSEVAGRDAFAVLGGSLDSAGRLRGFTLSGDVVCVDVESMAVQTVFSIPMMPSAFDLADDGELIAFAYADGRVLVRRAATGEVVQDFRDFTEGAPVSELALIPGGHAIAVTDDRTAVRLRDLETGAVLREWPASSPGNGRSMAAFPDGRRLLLVDSGAARIVDVRTGETLLRLEPAATTCVACSPDGRLIATGGLDPTVRIWDAADGRMLSALEGQPSEVIRIAFSPDARRVATAGIDHSLIRIFDPLRPQSLFALRGTNMDARRSNMGFSPDGNAVFTTAATGPLQTAQFQLWRAGHPEERLVHGLYEDLIVPSRVTAAISADASLSPQARERALWLVRSLADAERMDAQAWALCWYPRIAHPTTPGPSFSARLRRSWSPRAAGTGTRSAAPSFAPDGSRRPSKRSTSPAASTATSRSTVSCSRRRSPASAASARPRLNSKAPTGAHGGLPLSLVLSSEAEAEVGKLARGRR